MEIKEIEFKDSEIVKIQYQRLMNFIAIQQQLQDDVAELKEKLNVQMRGSGHMMKLLYACISSASDENAIDHVFKHGVSSVDIKRLFNTLDDSPNTILKIKKQ